MRPVEPSGDLGWFAYPKSPATMFRQGGERRPLPREREPHVGPIGIRMFVDDASGIGLWPGKGWHDHDLDPDEETLPIADDLRGRIRDWVDEYTESIGSKPHWTLEQLVDHDIRGHQLATELQDDLGADYAVEFSCNTAEFSWVRTSSPLPPANASKTAHGESAGGSAHATHRGAARSARVD